MTTTKNLRIRTATDNSIKAYIDKSEKYKGYQRLAPIHKILEEVRQEGKPLQNWNINFSERKAIAKLSDHRGSLSRYTKISGLKFPSYSYLVEFLEAGGKIDQVSGWGFSLSQLIACEAARIEPTTLVYLFNYAKRTDYGNYEAIIFMLENGLMPRNKKEFDRNIFIYDRIRMLSQYDLEWNKSLLSLGFLRDKNFYGYILDNVSHEIFHNNIARFNVYHFVTTNFDFDGNSCEMTPLASPKTKLGKKRLNDIQKYLKRQRLITLTHRKQNTDITSNSMKATAYVAKMYCDKTKDKTLFLGFRPYNYRSVNTTVGKIANTLRLQKIASSPYRSLEAPISKVGVLIQVKEDSFWSSNVSYILHKARRIKDYWVCQIETKWFVWKDDFIDHLEANSLKDAFERIEKRRKKDNLILCFNDVRNDQTGTAGFCISGTKGFLQKRMPFAYRLLAPYQNWSDVPSDIMDLDFYLADKSIFNGFPSPVR